ncbi:unnamed protein product [Adineta steineri]|uniref:PAW domain-containing protein n=1 Tax=Adineta steineri TaxID=433720 RepID=A0A815V6L8_9BILA|nr:unnamed protein product [Adineta steineri]CAF1526532.1 unnamed protein product [Adineta steineri]
MLNKEKSTKESELHGKQSGSPAWKLSRGERDQQKQKKDEWIDRLYVCSNIQRKIEKDWKMVYLCREHLHTNGILSWTIQLKPEEEKFYQFHHITIQCPTKAFDP